MVGTDLHKNVLHSKASLSLSQPCRWSTKILASHFFLDHHSWNIAPTLLKYGKYTVKVYISHIHGPNINYSFYSLPSTSIRIFHTVQWVPNQVIDRGLLNSQHEGQQAGIGVALGGVATGKLRLQGD